ncbi:MAG TPA: hypothetical protein VJM33_17440 [Microthrixaceae bacterium]|nr:hypothetical protein [Microthrixaceae bacterium]
MDREWLADQVGPAIWPRRRLSRGEWTVALVVAVVIVVVNKAVIEDTGNWWGGLVLVSIVIGIIAAVFGSWVLQKARRT